MKIFVFLVLFSISPIFAQQDSALRKNTNVFPVWTFHDDSVNIHGISLGFGTSFSVRNTNTNGIKFELIGIGALYIFGPKSESAQSPQAFALYMKEPVSERINGLSMSVLGTRCDCITNGFAIGGIGQYNRQMNGFSGALIMNMAQVHNGIQLGILMNDSYIMNGIQVGVFKLYIWCNGSANRTLE